MEAQIWKVRAVKSYPQAQNHLLIGKVLEHTATFVRLRSRTFHFGRMVNSRKDIRVGPLAERIIPWGRIEVVNVLPEDFDYARAELQVDQDGDLVLHHGTHDCPIAGLGAQSDDGH